MEALLEFSLDQLFNNNYLRSQVLNVIYFDEFENEYVVVNIEPFGVHYDVQLWNHVTETEKCVILSGHEKFYIDYHMMGLGVSNGV